jgi:hypothetical protein
MTANDEVCERVILSGSHGAATTSSALLQRTSGPVSGTRCPTTTPGRSWRNSACPTIGSRSRARFSHWRYLTTRHFAEATFENWESEFLQMGAFVLLTVFLRQKGSGESKQDHDDPRDKDPRGHQDDPDAP